MFLCDSLRYEVVKESIISDEIGIYESFGIKAVNSEGKEMIRYDDISLNEHTVIELCEKCNDFQLDPVHLLEVIEDFI